MKIQQETNQKKKGGFTIMEMVVVLAIIAIILGVAVNQLSGVQNFASIKQAEGELNSLNTALLMYKSTGGQYPTQAQGLKALKVKPSTPPVPRRWQKNETAPEVDPWGNEYTYKFPGSKDKTRPEIISKGPDGQLGTEDDLSSQQ